LTKTNYDTWSLLMKLKMEARDLWEAVDTGDVDFHDDRTAFDAICSAVPEEMVPKLATKPSAKDAWEAIKTMRIDDDRMRRSTAQTVRVEYEEIKFKEGESVEDFSLRLTNLVQRLAVLGDPEPQHKVVRKYLRVAKPRYKQLVVSIETLLHIVTLSVEEVTGRLQAGADGEPEAPKTVSGKLLMTQDEWLEKYKADSGRGGSAPAGAPASTAVEDAGVAAATTTHEPKMRAEAATTRIIARPAARRAIGPKTAGASPRNNRPTWPKTTSPPYCSPPC
jgi:hypothetical protein